MIEACLWTQATDGPASALSASLLKHFGTTRAGQPKPLHSYQGLLAHMATLTRNTIRAGAATFDQLSLPTATQQRAFELLGAPRPHPAHPPVH